MLALLKENEDPSVAGVELRPKPESLNSINGYVTYADGERLFFKTHVEENEQLSEYYNSAALAKAGYPIITPRQITHRPGKQIVLYQIITFPTLFDLLKVEEDELLQGKSASARSLVLLEAQKRLEQNVSSIYERTLRPYSSDGSSGESAMNAGSFAMQADPPINQLFCHRLSEQGRYGLFYKGKVLRLDHDELKFDELAGKRWIINGVRYDDTLAQIVERSRTLLSSPPDLVVIGHGDAHNGNIFVDLEQGALQMFDPAFAGWHHPLLDLTKPLFHNIFARWMYFPEQVKNEFSLSCSIGKDEVVIEHDFFPSQLRLAHFEAKKEQLLVPTMRLLRESAPRGASPANNAARGTSPANNAAGGLSSANNAAGGTAPADSYQGHGRGRWVEYLRSSLFCCPFLTVNLFAPQVPDGTLSERYSLPIKLLGLSMAVSFGSLTHSGEDRLSSMIDNIFEV